MRWTGDRRRFQRLFLETEEPLREAVEFCAHLLDDLPLFSNLSREVVDDACLVGNRFLQMQDPSFGRGGNGRF